jgi:hypothetical protein
MKESPIYQEIGQEGMVQGERNSITKFLTVRFGCVPEEITRALELVEETEELDRLIEWAARCQSIEEFSAQMAGASMVGSRVG